VIIDHNDVAVKDAEAGVDVEMVSSPTAEGLLTLSNVKVCALCLILSMDYTGLDGKMSEKSTGKISTHGPRGSRRERWRTSKGMTPRPKSRGMNRQGTVASRHKPGRSHRRR
jgi:hypothetical protein